MASTVPASVIKNTQNSLGKHVKKPPLTEKLLRKPPFRFLHDVLSVVIRDTGALSGLFDDREMSAENVKDRDSKIKYLEKAIACVSFASGKTLTVKPAKIVSGHEAEKTNEFLQALGKIITQGVDTGDAVQRVLNGEKPGKTSNNSNNKENSKPASRSNGTAKKTPAAASGSNPSSRESTASKRNSANAAASNENGAGSNGNFDSGLGTLTEGGDEPRAGGRDGGDGQQQDPRPEPDQDADAAGQPKAGTSRRRSSANSSAAAAAAAKAATAAEQLPDEGIGSEQDSSLPVLGDGQATAEEDKGGDSSQQQQASAAAAPSQQNGGGQGVPRPGSAMTSARPRTGRLKSARPPSARPAAPRLREKKEILAEEEMQHRPTTGKVANVIVAGEDNDDDVAGGGDGGEGADGGNEFLVEEKAKDALDLLTETAPSDAQADASAIASGGQEHGALVQQILETQKELEDKNKPKKTEIERESGISDLGRRRDLEATQREVDKLRESIQTLTRSANPLGKLMDFLQEDVDQMQRELENWKKENQQLQLQLRHEQQLTDQSVEPLKAHLTDLESAVQDQLDKISVVKANILKNDDKIARMLGSIGTAAR